MHTDWHRLTARKQKYRQTKARTFMQTAEMTVVINPVYIRLLLQPTKCFNLFKACFPVAMRFGERYEPYPTCLPLWILWIQPTEALWAFLHHAIQSWNTSTPVYLLKAKFDLVLSSRDPALLAIHGLWLAEVACHSGLPWLVNWNICEFTG